MIDAIQRYHELLTDEVAEASQEMLDGQLQRRHLYFGDRPLCTVLRPRLMSPLHHRRLQGRVGLLGSAFGKAYAAALADRGFRAQFGLLDWEESMLEPDPGFRHPCPTSRPDFFLVDATGEMGLTEYNAETPAGPGFHDALAAAFETLPVMRAFERDFELRPLGARHGVLHVLLDAWEQFSGTRSRPRIAIVDWDDVPTRGEFELFRQYFHDLGFPCIITTPEALEYRQGRLVAGGEIVDLVYKRVLLSELVAHGGLDQPLVRAVRDGKACMVNPFRCKVLHKKASLGVLDDERNAHLFSLDEREAIRAFIPWTRIVEERRTMYHGEEVDLVAFMQKHREWLVLKPNDDYGGAGIVLGWMVDDIAWEAAIARALSIPYIVQRRVQVPTEPYPSLVDGRLSITDRMIDTAPFVSHGAYAQGCLTRLSTDPLLNVTAGGGSTVPTFIVEPR